STNQNSLVRASHRFIHPAGRDRLRSWTDETVAALVVDRPARGKPAFLVGSRAPARHLFSLDESAGVFHDQSLLHQMSVARVLAARPFAVPLQKGRGVSRQ